jgi:hypothetical protein
MEIGHVKGKMALNMGTPDIAANPIRLAKTRAYGY